MMIWASILVFVIIAVLLIFALVALILKGKTYRNKRVVKSLLLIYVVAMALSVFVYEFLPKKVNGDLRIVQADENNPFYKGEMVLDDRPEYDDYLQNQWKFDYDKQELRIMLIDGRFNGPIVLERKTVNDGVVEAKYYASTVMDGVDLTNELPSLDIKVEGDTLQLIGTSSVKAFNYTIYQKEFTITQFTKENKRNFDLGTMNTNYLYLKVPKDVKIINHTNMYIDE